MTSRAGRNKSTDRALRERWGSTFHGDPDIFKVTFNGTGTDGDPVALTADPAPDFEPRWSPNDNELAYYSRRFGTRDLFTVRADGRSHESRLTDLPGNEYDPDWAPDWRQIVFSSQVSYGLDVFGMNAVWAPSGPPPGASASVWCIGHDRLSRRGPPPRSPHLTRCHLGPP